MRLVLACLALGCATVPAPLAPSSPPAESARPEPAAEATPTRFTALRANVHMCGLTDLGTVQCWGYTLPTGEDSSAVPVPVPGLAPLGPVAGFSLPNRRTLLAWNAEGRAMTVHTLSGEAPTYSALLVTTVHNARDPRERRIVEGRGYCVRARDGEVLCAREASTGEQLYSGGPRGTLRLGAAGRCIVDAQGSVQHVRVEGQLPARWIREPLDLPHNPNALVCQRTETGVEGCTLGGEVEGAALPPGTVQCSTASLTARVRALANGGARGFHADHMLRPCVIRADGSAGCEARFPSEATLLTGLDGLDVRGGIGVVGDTICGLGGDGVARCFGNRDSAVLSGERGPHNGQLRHFEAFDGARRIAADGGIVCVQLGERELRCFGGPALARVSPEPFTFPEPIDELVGGYVLCARSAAGEWRCRDVAGVSFRGPRGAWLRLRDQHGRPLREAVRSISPEVGSGVSVVLASGEPRAFIERANRVPFRLVPFPVFGARVAATDGLRGAIRPDGSGFAFVDQGMEDRIEFPSPVHRIEGRCALHGEGSLSCLDETGAVLSRLEGITQLRGAALGVEGEVYVRPPNEASWIRREGLPPMRAVAGSCGLSRRDELWCWGARAQTPLPMLDFEPREVRPAS